MKKYWENQLINFDDLNFSDLIGATINRIGFHPEVREGGLTIDYEKKSVKKRIILGYNDLGTWIVWQGEEKPNKGDLLLLKISKMIKNGSWDKIDYIKDDPMNLCYRFMSYGNHLREKTYEEIESLPKGIRERNSTEIFRLTIIDIKLLPDHIGRLFQKRYDNEETRFSDIIGTFEMECVE